MNERPDEPDRLELWLFLLSWLPGPLGRLLFLARPRRVCASCGARRPGRGSRAGSRRPGQESGDGGGTPHGPGREERRAPARRDELAEHRERHADGRLSAARGGPPPPGSRPSRVACG